MTMKHGTQLKALEAVKRYVSIYQQPNKIPILSV